MTTKVKTPDIIIATTGKPERIVITELTETAYAQAAVLVRTGYRFCKFEQPRTFDFSGNTTITLVLGDPDADAITGAALSQSIAFDRQNARTARDDATAVAQTKAHQEREAAKAALSAEILSAKAHVKQLEQAARTA